MLAHASGGHAHGAHALCLSAPTFFVFVSAHLQFQTKSTEVAIRVDLTSSLSAVTLRRSLPRAPPLTRARDPPQRSGSAAAPVASLIHCLPFQTILTPFLTR